MRIDHKLGYVFLDENGIVWKKFHVNPEFTLENVEEFAKIWERICANQKRCFIIDLRETFALLSVDFLQQISAHPNAQKWKKAEAILIDNLSLNLMSNFYKRVVSPKFPVKIFTDEQEAIAWAQTF